MVLRSVETSFKRRVFFALWPDENVREKVSMINRQLMLPESGGRLMSDSNLHLTLYYIGSVNHKQMQCLHTAAKNLKCEPFKLRLDCLGYFMRPKVLWLGCKDSPAGYIELLKQLAVATADCGLNLDAENNTPHVTLRRKLSQPERFDDIEQVDWDVEQFVLVESVSTESGVSYRIIENYGLKGA